MEKKRKCSATVAQSGGFSCAKKASVERDGRWYCGLHDPEKVKARREKSEIQFKEKWEARQRSREEGEKRKAEIDRKLAAYESLLSLLEEVSTVLWEIREEVDIEILLRKVQYRLKEEKPCIPHG